MAETKTAHVTSVRPNLVEQHEMKDIIDTFDVQQYTELFRIIERNGAEYTKNVNGIFINLKLLNDKTMIEVKNYVDYIKKTNIHLKVREKNIKK